MKPGSFAFVTTLLLAGHLAHSQANQLIDYVPKDANLVINIDIKRMAGKIPPEIFRRSVIYEQLMKDNMAKLEPYITDPAKAGIDISAGIMIPIKFPAPAVVDTAKNEDDEEMNFPANTKPSLACLLKIGNPGVFKLFITGMLKEMGGGEGEDDVKIQTTGDVNFLGSANKMILAWNNDVMVVGDYSDPSEYTNLLKHADLEKMEAFAKEVNVIRKKSTTQLLSRLNAGASEKLRTEFQKPADIKLWSDGNSGDAFPRRLAGLNGAMDEMRNFIGKDRISLIDFENGKAVMQSTTYPGDALKQIHEKNPFTKANTELLRKLPYGTAYAVVNISYPDAMSAEYLKASGLESMLPLLQKQVPFDLEKAIGVLGGDIMLAVMDQDIRFAKADGVFAPQVIVAARISDKAKFEALKTEVLKAWKDMKKDKGEDEKGKGQPVIKYNDRYVVLSLDEKTATAYLNNPGNSDLPKALGPYIDNPLAMMVDTRKLMELVTGLMNAKRGVTEDPAETGERKKVLDQFGPMVMYGGRYANGVITNKGEISFGPKDANVLISGFEFITQMAPLLSRSRKYDEESFGIDTVTAVEDSTTIELPPPPAPPVKKPAKAPAKKPAPRAVLDADSKKKK